MIVAIHQPNYAPWLGYFNKIARCDAFIFLDDVQYSRGGYTNRVRIGRAERSVWLTQPVKREFGSAICCTRFSSEDWSARHLDSLKGAYAGAASFREAWPVVRKIWEQAPLESLAVANQHIVQSLAAALDLTPRFVSSSSLSAGTATGDARLVRLLQEIAPAGGTYLSGKGGANYQSADTFSAAGYELRYGEFQQAEYPRGDAPFVAGLSILDALFHCGVGETRRLVQGI